MFFYIHIPFCRQKCLYCKFALTPRFDAIKVRTYIDVLKKEIAGFFQENPDTNIESIYFGGGTPSILSGEQIRGVLEVFRKSGILSKEVEITLESNPGDISDSYLTELSGLGINRLSLGVQTLNNEALRMIGRADSNEIIFRALESISHGPITNISIDLIAGLPGTGPGQTVDDLERVYSYISPKHVSIYMLEDELYPESWKKYLPDENTIQDEYLSATEWLWVRGLCRYELSNFAIPGFESKHNKSYWNHSQYRGFGLSSASFVGGERCANSSSFTGYYQGERQSDGVLDDEALRIERIMFGFRTNGVSLDDIRNAKKLTAFVEDGLLERNENRVFLTSTGIFLIDYIIGKLI